uniref:AAT family amino acid transporter n=1 Tax=Streptomyces sp. NBC_00093 TaxID=2975649 RepID=A0AAU2AE18_9ACTN
MTTPLATEGSVRAPVVQRSLPWFAHGLANLAVVTALALASWYLLVDPKWSGLDIYPQPLIAFIFWTVTTFVWLGFNLDFHGFDRLPQPLRGIALILFVTTVGVGITFTLAYGWGHFDATFAADRAGGAGYLTGALFTLFGFFMYVTGVINWGRWPWSKLTTRQPWVGLGQITLLTVPTFILYAVLALPGLATWADPAKAWFTTPTLIGWFYSIIVSSHVTGLLTDNWPWRLAGSPGRVALASVVGNAVVGTGLYYVLLSLSKVLMGSSNADAIGPGVTIFAAELGVCWLFWMIFWANAFGNWPNGPSPARNHLVRVGITLGLGIATFLAYYFFIAGSVLHEPLVAGGMHGDALGWMDWMLLWTLFYVFCLESYGLPRRREPEPAEA